MVMFPYIQLFRSLFYNVFFNIVFLQSLNLLPIGLRKDSSYHIAFVTRSEDTNHKCGIS